MRIGVVFPQTEIGNDPAAIRDYAQAVEGLGFSHILAYDHVLGANPERLGGFSGPYTCDTPFHELMVLFSFLAGITYQLELVTGILILPQRQTALVAKQAASLDILSRGRLRLGVGLGWNEIEYTALNENFHNRGKRVEEQVDVLRKLWADQLVVYHGRWHTIPDAGLNPLPTNRSIPVWFGGHADPVLRRAARLGDGWMPNYPRVSEAQPSLDRLSRYLEAEGRSRDSFGLEARLAYKSGDEQIWKTILDEWRDAGATHISFNTMGCGFGTTLEHIKGIEAFSKVAL